MKRNPVFWVGIGLPVAFILLLFGTIYLPTISIRPQHNFIYTNTSQYNYNVAYKNRFTVTNGKISLEPLSVSTSTYGYNPQTIVDTPDLFEYDVKNNTAHKITLTEAQNLNIDPGPASPDGYTVAYDYNNDGLFGLFGGGGAGGYVIRKNSAGKRLTGITTNGYYSNQGDFQLIGWIK